MTAASNDPMRMPSFAQTISSGACAPNASVEIKIDIVNPIPHSTPTAIICLNVVPCGNDASFSFVASQQKRLNAPGILHALGIHRAFDFCADASRIVCSKPDPEIFLAACAGLNVRPGAAIGVEDAPAGVAAINAAGMLSVGIGSGLTHAGLQLHSTQELTWKCLTDFWASRAY